MTLRNLILTFLLAMNAHAGPIRDRAMTDPEGTLTFIRTANYADFLKFVRDAYAEYLAENKDPVLEYTYMLAINEAALDKQIPLALDFSLVQADMVIRQMGARAIYLALIKGAQLDAARRQQTLSKLKTDLQTLTSPSREAFDFARYAAYALMLLSDDVGLDVFLTDSETLGTYRLKDNWQPDSAATTFQSLASQYTQRAADPSNQDPEWDKTLSAAYFLAKERRNQGKEVKSLQPINSLERLKTF